MMDAEHGVLEVVVGLEFDNPHADFCRLAARNVSVMRHRERMITELSNDGIRFRLGVGITLKHPGHQPLPDHL